MVMGNIAVETDVLVIGGGPGGYTAAIRAAQLGKEVVLVERDELGGICLNHGCIPSKALIQATHEYQNTKQLGKMGINTGEVTLDAAKLQQWKQGVVTKLRTGLEGLFKKYGIELVKGEAFFQSSKRIAVTTEHGMAYYEPRNIVIATGSKAVQIKGFEFNGKSVMSAKEALQMSQVPKQLIIIGGGYIGLEMGTFYANAGCKVTIVEGKDRIMQGSEKIPGAEPDVIAIMEKRLKALGVEIFTGTRAESYKEEAGGVIVTLSNAQGKREVKADKILVAAGVKPNTDSLQLENTKVQLDEMGFVKVDAQRRTTEPHVFAVGDVACQPMLAHKAFLEGKVAAEVIGGLNSAYEPKVVPAVVYSEPEIAYVGLTEGEAIKKGLDILSAKYPFAALGRAATMNETDGFVKVVALKSNGEIVGVQIVGPEASDLVSEVALAIEMGATVEDVSLVIHPHPTLSEALLEACELIMGKAIHYYSPPKK